MRNNLVPIRVEVPAKIYYFPLSCQPKAPFSAAGLEKGVLREDIPEKYHDLVDTLGMKAFLQLVDLCGGITLYIPQMESLKRGARDREIRARFDGGNYRTLAVQFRLGEKQIRKIINGKRH